jgi:2-hydroxychromene-2-carboxylate isomerase
MKEVSFFFDFSSPFAYLGATQIEAVAARHAARVRYRPFLLGGLFKEIGTPDVPLFTMPEAKRKHAAADMWRWAEYYDVPFRFPTRFPMNSVKALRVLLQLDPDRMRDVVLPIFRAYWAEDQDISDDAVLEEILSKAGLDGRAMVLGTKDEAVKTRLRSSTEEAVKAGVCGAPCFLVGDLLFWGQDRLLFVEKALDGWRPKGE